MFKDLTSTAHDTSSSGSGSGSGSNSSAQHPQRRKSKSERRKSLLFHSTQKLQVLVSKVMSSQPSSPSVADAPGNLDVGREPEFRWINGRRFHDIVGVEYPLPNDSLEQERLHSQHMLLKLAFQGLFSAPVDYILNAGARVLDIGCGPGSWVLDMAKNYPRSHFVGIDISDQFPSDQMLRRNCEFMIANAAQRLPFPDESFDYIHQRLLSLSLTTDQWHHVMSEIRRLLKPGGYVELTELDCDFQRWGPMGKNGLGIFHSYIRMRGINPTMARGLPAVMSRARLTPQHCSFISMPLGRWGGKLGFLFAEDLQKAIRSLKPLVVYEHAIMPDADFEHLCEMLPQEWEQHLSYTNYFKCFGRKGSVGSDAVSS